MLVVKHIFDFECAIHLRAPECHHCGCKLIGNGVEKKGNVFCCRHCADHSGYDVYKRTKINRIYYETERKKDRYFSGEDV